MRGKGAGVGMGTETMPRGFKAGLVVLLLFSTLLFSTLLFTTRLDIVPNGEEGPGQNGGGFSMG